MATSPARRNRNQRRMAKPFLAIGAVMIAIGLVIVLIADGSKSDGIGYTLMILGSLPTIVGLTLVAASLVETREREDRPWA